MARELEQAARNAYGVVSNTRRGTLARSDLEALGARLAPLGSALPVAAAWSAARAVIFPQLELNLVKLARTACEEVRLHLAADPAPPPEQPLLVLEAFAKQASAAGSDPMAPRRASAALAVAHALSCCVTPSPKLFADTAEQLALAQEDPAYPNNRAQELWTGWLDDVITRSDRFSVIQILELLTSTIDGTLPGLLPSRFTWEGTGNEEGGFEVWTEDPRSHKLVMPVVTFSQFEPKGGTLFVRIANKPGLVKDGLRLEYFAEHEVHRYFLASPYAGKFTVIDYQFEDGSPGWQARV